jgi:hypothetical protein
MHSSGFGLADRKSLLDWLHLVLSSLTHQVTCKYKTDFKVWEHSVFLFDQCLGAGCVDKNSARLLAATCLLVAVKVEKE